MLGQDGIEVLVDPNEFNLASDIFNRVKMGESWTGQFPVKNKMGKKFAAVATNTPFYDDDGSLVGVICVSSDSRPFLQTTVPLAGGNNAEPDSGSNCPRSGITSKIGLDSQQPVQVTLASKISNLVSVCTCVLFMFLYLSIVWHWYVLMLLQSLKQASKVSNKVKSKMRTRENNVDGEGGSGESHHSEYGLSDHREDGNSSGASTPRGEVPPSPFGVFSHVEGKFQGKTMRDSGNMSEVKPMHKIITSKAEAWIQKKTSSWPWRANDQEGSNERNVSVAWPWLQGDQEKEPVNQRNLSSGSKPESRAGESNQPVNNEASGSWSSFNVNSTSSTSSCGSSSSCAANSKVDVDTDCLDYEILWEDLTIGEPIGQGSHVLN